MNKYFLSTDVHFKKVINIGVIAVIVHIKESRIVTSAVIVGGKEISIGISAEIVFTKETHIGTSTVMVCVK